MKAKGSVLQGIVVFLLVIVIFGGVGYLGYNIIFKGNAGMNMASSNSSNTENMSGMSGTDQNNGKMEQNDSQEATTTVDSSYKTSQAAVILQNKQLLVEAVNSLNTALNGMTLDPYADANQSSTSSQEITDSQTKDPDLKAGTDNTTVNIYTAPVDSQTQTQTATQSTGKVYDAEKMEKVHTALYNFSVGTELLNQLVEELNQQMDQVGIDTTDKTAFYIAQYNLAIQNKNQLEDAANYINQGVDLININPYVDANGNAQEIIDMDQLHQSTKLYAQGVVKLNQLSQKLTTQAVQLGNLAQTSYNQANTTTTSTMTMTSGMNSNGIFGNVNATTVIIIVLVGFVIIFIIALIGSIAGLFKPSKPTGYYSEHSEEWDR